MSRSPSPPPLAAPKPRGRPGRPAIHLDGAERSRAYRERVQDRLALGDAAAAILENPTPLLLTRVAERLVRRATSQTEAASTAIAAVLAGLHAGGGDACLNAALTASQEWTPTK